MNASVNAMESTKNTSAGNAGDECLSVRGMHTWLHARQNGKQSDVHLVRGIDFDIRCGKTLALVGESGSGKSLTSLSLMRLLARSQTWSHQGSAMFTAADGRQHDLLSADESTLRGLRGNHMAMIFQEPMTCLNPVLSIGDQLSEPLRWHKGLDARAAQHEALRALEEVEIPAAAQRLGQYPHQLSGGMRQRVMIAMAMVCRPRLLIADEPTTALDVTIQAQILKLITRLRHERGMAVLFITHNLGVVAHHSDDVAVMYAGQIVESTAVKTLFSSPTHPYTNALLRCLPGQRRLGRSPQGEEAASGQAPSTALYAIRGQAPNMAQLGTGCAFAPRCDSAQPDCHTKAPNLLQSPHRQWRCPLKAEPLKEVV
jgi:peptide/nickel transport system ATP-binding protein